MHPLSSSPQPPKHPPIIASRPARKSLSTPRIVILVFACTGMAMLLLVGALLLWRHYTLYTVPHREAKKVLSHLDQNVDEVQLRSWAAYYLTNTFSDPVTVNLQGSGLETLESVNLQGTGWEKWESTPALVKENGISFIALRRTPNEVIFIGLTNAPPPRANLIIKLKDGIYFTRIYPYYLLRSDSPSPETL